MDFDCSLRKRESLEMCSKISAKKVFAVRGVSLGAGNTAGEEVWDDFVSLLINNCSSEVVQWDNVYGNHSVPNSRWM